MLAKAKFFNEPQAAAILKHGILKRYLPVFVTKTGSVAGQVVYLDCFAGPGQYEDQSDGSPALALQTAEAIAGYQGRATLHGHLIEVNPSGAASLRELLEDHGAAWDVHEGRAEEYVPGILQALDVATPVFAFIDPFGLPIPFEMVVEILKRIGTKTSSWTRSGAPTEVLMNFSTSGINRVGGQLTGTGTDPGWLKARDTMVGRMDAALGGSWWQDIWRSEAPDRVDQIRTEYRKLLREAAGGEWGCFDVDVSDRWHGPPAYHLLLFTSHPDGVWQFNECLSLAQEEYRIYCHSHEGILDLEPLAEREKKWVEHIEGNVDELLNLGPFQPVYRLTEVYGRLGSQGGITSPI